MGVEIRGLKDEVGLLSASQHRIFLKWVICDGLKRKIPLTTVVLRG